MPSQGDFTFASGRELLARPGRATAIISSNDQMSLAALEVARELRFAVPANLSPVSFDNTPIVKFAQAPLTAVDQPIEALTARAAERLIQVQREPALLESGQSTVVPAAVTVRDSTAPPRI